MHKYNYKLHHEGQPSHPTHFLLNCFALARLFETLLCQDTQGGEWVCVRHTTNKHGADGEDLLGVGVGRDVTKAHAGQTAEGKVKGSDVGATYCRAPQCAVNVRCLKTFAQLVEPPLEKKQQCETKTCKLRFMSSTVCVFC